MAVWQADNQDLGFNLAQNGFVAKFYARKVLDDTLSTFQFAGYRIVSLDAGQWSTELAMHHSFSTALHFPTYYGRNLDALADCLSDVAELDYGWTETDTGLIIVIESFDRFYTAMPEIAITVLNIVSQAASRGALLGNRLLCFVRSGDPRLELGQIGGYDPQWNQREWLDSNRTHQ